MAIQKSGVRGIEQSEIPQNSAWVSARVKPLVK